MERLDKLVGPMSYNPHVRLEFLMSLEFLWRTRTEESSREAYLLEPESIPEDHVYSDVVNDLDSCGIYDPEPWYDDFLSTDTEREAAEQFAIAFRKIVNTELVNLPYREIRLRPEWPPVVEAIERAFKVITMPSNQELVEFDERNRST